MCLGYSVADWLNHSEKRCITVSRNTVDNKTLIKTKDSLNCCFVCLH
uniref:Uncharacterized protein n=1 Tax=Parascaris equorum TaxID=6256 RepID=A0A914S7S5_PAREQ